MALPSRGPGARRSRLFGQPRRAAEKVFRRPGSWASRENFAALDLTCGCYFAHDERSWPAQSRLTSPEAFAMRSSPCWQLVLVLFAIITPAALAADEPDDLKLLAGSWKPTAADLGGNKIDAMVLEKASFTVEGEKYSVSVNDFTEKGTFKLDPKKEPRQLDFFPTEGNNNGKTFLCVYKIDGDVLTICYSLDGSTRPENFEPLSNTLLLVKYERVKNP
jgi:uncharacterized protein (TIGR03067 family)